jgi:hypothetical protein
MTFPAAHRTKLHSTKPLEHLKQGLYGPEIMLNEWVLLIHAGRF